MNFSQFATNLYVQALHTNSYYVYKLLNNWRKEYDERDD